MEHRIFPPYRIHPLLFVGLFVIGVSEPLGPPPQLTCLL